MRRASERARAICFGVAGKACEVLSSGETPLLTSLCNIELKGTKFKPSERNAPVREGEMAGKRSRPEGCPRGVSGPDPVSRFRSFPMTYLDRLRLPFPFHLAIPAPAILALPKRCSPILTQGFQIDALRLRL